MTVRFRIVMLAALAAGCSAAQEGGAATFRTIGRDTSAMVFAASTSHAAVEAAARKHCAGRQWCKVLGWTDPRAAATAMPMTEREMAAQKFSYTLNRETGMDEAEWR